MSPPLVLSETEAQLCSASFIGEGLDLRGRTDGVVRASVLRALLEQHPMVGAEVHPRGIQLTGGIIRDPLDLSFVEAVVPLVLVEVRIVEPILLFQGKVKHLIFIGCEIEVFGAAVAASGVQVQGDLRFERCRIVSASPNAAMDLMDANIHGRLHVSGGSVTNSLGAALRGDRLRVNSQVRLDMSRFRGSGAQGVIALGAARLDDQVILAGSSLENPCGPTLVAPNVHVGSDLVACDRFESHATCPTDAGGGIDLRHATIAGNLLLWDGTFENRDGAAICAQSLHLAGNVYGRDARITGYGEHGAINIAFSHVEGEVDIAGATIQAQNGPSIYAEGLRVGGKIEAQGLQLTADSDSGAFHVASATIGRQFDLAGAHLVNTFGPALFVSASEVGGSLFLNEGHQSYGAGKAALQLSNSVVHGNLIIEDARIENREGPAIQGDSMQVNGNFQMNDRLYVRGAGGDGALRLVGARIGGQLVVGAPKACDVTVVNSSGPALLADTATVEGGLSLGVPLSGADVSADLHGASARYLRLQLQHFSPTSQIQLGEMTYVGLPADATVAQWTSFLEECTPNYQPQPYRHLAEQFQRNGFPRRSQHILIAQEIAFDRTVLRRAIRSARGRERIALRARRVLRWLFRKTLGYGYRPGRAVWLLFLFVGIAVMIGCIAARTHDGTTRRFVAERQPQRTGEAVRDCSTFEQVGLGIRVVVPFIPEVITGNCEISTAHTTGGAFSTANLILEVAGWTSGTLAIAAVTGVLRTPRP